MPSSSAAAAARVIAAMTKGLRAENAGNYAEAEQLYAAAVRLDPGDPTPLRYLGELYRHHIGDWVKARAGLRRRPGDARRRSALARRGPPRPRQDDDPRGPVREGPAALRGIGRGSIPLALTYRNLSVYWNSEGHMEKAGRYVDLALALEPDEPYNRVFAAIVHGGHGRGEEALRIAKENEKLLPASYNLAAIYAQVGQKDEALRLLKRHFYEYERFKAVREKEMMEARVDAVFASINTDPALPEGDRAGRRPARTAADALMPGPRRGFELSSPRML